MIIGILFSIILLTLLFSAGVAWIICMLTGIAYTFGSVLGVWVLWILLISLFGKGGDG